MPKKSINLLQEQQAPPTFWENFYVWITKSARVVVILTEAVVLVAFGMRFYLDRKLNDLKNQIEQKGSTLEILAEEEKEIRRVQSKISAYGTLWESSSNFDLIFQDINTYIPVETDKLEISLSDDGINTILSVKGELERSLINDLENNFKDSDNYRNVSLNTIQRASGGEIYEFSLSAEVNLNNPRTEIKGYETSESET